LAAITRTAMPHRKCTARGSSNGTTAKSAGCSSTSKLASEHSSTLVKVGEDTTKEVMVVVSMGSKVEGDATRRGRRRRRVVMGCYMEVLEQQLGWPLEQG